MFGGWAWVGGYSLCQIKYLEPHKYITYLKNKTIVSDKTSVENYVIEWSAYKSLFLKVTGILNLSRKLRCEVSDWAGFILIVVVQ